MSTSTKTLTPEQQSALAKFQAFAGQQQQGSTNPLLQYIDPQSKGGAWSTKSGKSSGAGFGFEGMLDQIGQRLSGKGITAKNIEQLGVRTLDEKDEEGNPIQEIYDKTTGKTVSSGASVDLGGWGEGPGMTYGSLTFDEKGKPKISTYGEDTSDMGKIMPLLMMATLPFGGVGGLLGGAGSSLAGGIASLGIPQAAANIGANALLSGVAQGGISKLAGGDFGKGFKSGVVSGGIGAGVSELGAMTGLDKGLGSFYAPAKSLATSALTAAARGKPFDLGQAVKGAAINYGLNEAIGAGGKELGIDPKQQAAMMKFYNFAAPMIAAQRRKP